ncbi:MAG: SAM-dependent methyltransferase [Hydrogenophilales bacterium CG_4_9_14_3_um_filter_63_34]|nr:MAG: SAM-dependent methyltransferase [Hydrogenophilales bacterium CG_4_10_14_3_um_filter_63_21]PJB03195.1 MAG: SAM-dependent methyltransferase [Hydrogenophilales bacterium CG_4_9_14_3_um_filter_63_34]
MTASQKPRRAQARHLKAPAPSTFPALATALDALERVLEFERPADAVLSYFFRNDPKLGGHDRAFIAEAVYGVLRRLRGLQALAAPATPRRLLLAWAARHGGINLRQFEGVVKDDELTWLKEMKAADLATQPEAVRLELPDWLYEKLHARYGDHLPALAEALNRPAPLDLRVNTLKMARDDVLKMFAFEGIAATPTPYSPLGLRLQGKPALQKHPLFIEGGVEVQDEGSQLLGLLLAPRRGEMVCDFCAGAGGKTLLLGALMANTGRLYAYDISEKRLHNLKPRLARSGLSNVHPQLIAHERDPKIKRLAGKFDRVLVDAPCSGLGTLRRNPDLKWRQSLESLAELTAKQAAILESAARLVKAGGRLVYATCSLLEEENEAIVHAFLAAHPNFRLVPVGEVLAAQNISLAAESLPASADYESGAPLVGEMGEFLRLDPAVHNTDGFFAGVLERTA